MQIAKTIAEARTERAKMKKTALVPTMGALHAGHLSLIEIAKKQARKVIVSIFVNPTQFGPKEDFNRYPRPIEEDLKKCEAAGVELVFNPSPQEMYPANSTETIVDFPSLTTVLEGKHRPGHFKGVCQIVAKLFNILQPTAACFGKKDFQQLRVLSAMVEEMNFPVEIIECPTVREPDGLAMSSRNQYLSPDERERALSISRALSLAQGEVRSGIRQTNRLTTSMQRILLEQHLNIDYIAAVDPRTLKTVDLVEQPVVLAIAARVGKTRLIDNVTVDAG